MIKLWVVLATGFALLSRTHSVGFPLSFLLYGLLHRRNVLNSRGSGGQGDSCGDMNGGRYGCLFAAVGLKKMSGEARDDRRQRRVSLDCGAWEARGGGGVMLSDPADGAIGVIVMPSWGSVAYQGGELG